ncbi:Mechanosensitive ion channel protein 5 [Leucoagaricus sp. SymC.cos]|nr:Mechanosensitive ion channel protein 5 [Leucoagaricus sp. SymC.cos]
MDTNTDGNDSNNTNNSPAINLASSPTERLIAGRRGEVHEDPFATSQEELSTLGIASPLYKPVASSSNLRFLLPDENDHYEEYPLSLPYEFTSQVNLLEEAAMGEEPPRHRSRREETFVEDEKQKPSVHYSENIKPFQYVGMRQDSSGDYMSSRASSIAGPEDEDSEDYDWSGEEDLVDEEVKFEKQMGVKTKTRGWGPRRIIALLFSSLLGSTFVAGLLVIPPLLVHFYWYEPHPTDHRRYVKDNIQAWFFWAAANLVISWWLALVIDLVPIVARFIIAAAWGHVSEFVKNRIEMYNSVKGNIKPVFYAASGWLSWTIIFGGIFKLFDSNEPSQSRAGYTYRLSQVVEFMFFFAMVFCASRMLSHAIAFNFHRTAYKERMDSLEQALTVIEKLRDYRPVRSAGGHYKTGTRTPVLKTSGFSDKEHAKRLSQALKNVTPPQSSHGHGDDGNDGDISDMDHDGTLVTQKGRHNKNRRSWFEFGKRDDSPGELSTSQSGSPDRCDNPVDEIELRQQRIPPPSSRPLTPSNLNPHRYPPQGHSEDESSRQSVDGGVGVRQAAKVLRSAVLHDARNIKGTADEDLAQLSWNVSSSHEAKRLARSIYTRFKDRHRKYLIPSDFYPAFPTEDAAKEAFRVFDKDDNGDISRAEIKTTLLKGYKERRFLSRSMRDVGEALKTLHRIILFFAAVILFFISLSVFGVEVGNSLTSVYSLGIAASFIFKNSASSAFDAIMFLFVTHPFDTGDRCFINQENLVVKKVGLFATVFSRSDGTETYYFNSQLSVKFITNVRRSGKTFENLAMQVAWRTPLEKLDALERCLNEWLATEENRWYEPATTITFQHIVYQRYLELTIGIAHNSNWQDWGRRNARKTAFHAAVQYYCNQLGIIGYEAPIPVVYADLQTKMYNPEKLQSLPTSSFGPGYSDSMRPEEQVPQERARREAEMQDIERVARSMKPSLGFLPPLSNRESTLTRARKSKSRKAVLRGVDA